MKIKFAIIVFSITITYFVAGLLVGELYDVSKNTVLLNVTGIFAMLLFILMVWSMWLALTDFFSLNSTGSRFEGNKFFHFLIKYFFIPLFIPIIFLGVLFLILMILNPLFF